MINVMRGTLGANNKNICMYMMRTEDEVTVVGVRGKSCDCRLRNKVNISCGKSVTLF